MKPWPLPELVKADRNAVTVYVGLRWLAGDSQKLETTRRRIREVVGLSEKRITAAMAALDRAGWIRLRRGWAPGRRWYRVSFAKRDFFPCVPKTTSRKKRRRAKKDRKETVTLGAEKDINSLKGVEHGPGLKGPGHATNQKESRAARIERERMAGIRAARLAEVFQR